MWRSDALAESSRIVPPDTSVRRTRFVWGQGSWPGAPNPAQLIAAEDPARLEIVIYNPTNTATLWVGDRTVNIGTGFPVPPRRSLRTTSTDALYFVTDGVVNVVNMYWCAEVAG